MQCNVGRKDAKLRFWGGLALLTTAITVKSPIIAIIGVVLMISGYTKKCYVYKVMGKDTTRGDNKNP